MFVDEFVKKTEKLCEKGIESIKAKSKNIEEAVIELIELLYPGKYEIKLNILQFINIFFN